jgi:hypothetical protein
MCSSSLKTELRVCGCYIPMERECFRQCKKTSLLTRNDLALSMFHPRHHILGINYRKELIFKDQKHITRN